MKSAEKASEIFVAAPNAGVEKKLRMWGIFIFWNNFKFGCDAIVNYGDFFRWNVEKMGEIFFSIFGNSDNFLRFFDGVFDREIIADTMIPFSHFLAGIHRESEVVNRDDVRLGI